MSDATPMFTKVVGEFKHKMATTILKHLPDGFPLILQREPGNPVDRNAIKVLVKITPEIREAVQKTHPEAVLQDEEWLGYVPKTEAYLLRDVQEMMALRNKHHGTSITVNYRPVA